MRISPELADLANQILDSEATGDPKLAMDWANEQLGNPRGPGVAPQGAGLMPSGRPYTNITDLVRETNPGLRPRPRNAVSLSQWRKGR